MRRTRLSLALAMLTVALTSPAQGERKVIVIDADKLAPPDLRAAEPMRGKWWLKRDAKDWEHPMGPS